MTPDEIARIKADPRFRDLERKRGGFSWTLCVIMLIVYFAFMLLVAFAPAVAGTPVWGVVTLAFPLGLGVILISIVLTGVYVLKANGEYDDLTRDVVSTMAKRSPPGRKFAA